MEQSGAHKKGGRRKPFNQRLQAAFIAAYEEVGSLRAAARAVPCSLQSHYNWLEGDPTYAGRFREADLAAGDNLIDEAVRRATTGDSDPILYRGKQVMVPLLNAKGQVVLDKHGQPRMIPAVRVRKSDNLLMFLIKAKRPEYRDRFQLDMRGGPGEGGDPDEGERKLNEPPPPDD